MAENYGWVGKILIVDLTTRVISTVATSDYVPKWIGGRALAAKLYWDEVPPSCGAFDPENRLIFASGPVGGTLGAGSSRTSIVTKSPETVPECYCYSTPGGHWAAELKFAGFDAVVVRGKAAGPVYIWIHDGEVKVLKAERLWGKTIAEAETEIRRLWGDKTRSMVIGPAGENLVKSAVILNDYGHATGHGGFGAVMGSKNLKAIAVQGTGGVKVKRPQDLIAFFDENVKIGGKYGGPYVASNEAYGISHGSLPGFKATVDIDTRFNSVDSYWAKESWLGYDEVMAGTLKSKFAGSFACPQCCELCYQPVDPTGKEEAPKDLNPTMTIGNQCYEYPQVFEFEDGKFGKRMGRPSILNYASHLGMGTTMFDMGYHELWFMEAVKAGLLTKENTGLPIGDYCSSEFVGPKGWTYGITYRTNDFFKRLAEGQIRFLEGMAKESAAWKTIYEKYIYRPRYFASAFSGRPTTSLEMISQATEVRKRPNDPLSMFSGVGKTLDGFLPLADIAAAQIAVRTKFASLLGPKSMDLGSEPQTFEGKVASVIFLQNMKIESDSMMYCGWMGFPRFYSLWTPDHVGDPSVGAKMLAAVTGIDRTMVENVAAMEAAWTLERAIHVREGHRREHDWYTDAFFAEAKWTTRDAFNKVLDDYYKARGWDVATGIPTRTQLVKLGMTDVADDLEKKYGVKVPA